jgi:hypothetical protein
MLKLLTCRKLPAGVKAFNEGRITSKTMAAANTHHRSAFVASGRIDRFNLAQGAATG